MPFVIIFYSNVIYGLMIDNFDDEYWAPSFIVFITVIETHELVDAQGTAGISWLIWKQ